MGLRGQEISIFASFQANAALLEIGLSYLIAKSALNDLFARPRAKSGRGIALVTPVPGFWY
jgi:hypothetical protein